MSSEKSQREEVSNDEGRLGFRCEYCNLGAEIGLHEFEWTLYHIVTVF